MASLVRVFVRGLSSVPKRSSARVASEESGMRLDRWLTQCTHRTVPHSLLNRLLRTRKIFVTDTAQIHKKSRVEASHRVQAGQYVHFPSYFAHARTEATTALSPAEIARAQAWVLYRDEHLLVLNKPAGLAVQGGSKLTRSLATYLSALQFDARDMPRLVHRLDQHASGVLVLARTRQVAQQLAVTWAEHRLTRLYWAVLIGQPKKLTGVIKRPLLRLSDRVVLADAQVTGVKPAVTHYDVLGTHAQLSLVALRPLTGRTHQLRVHCASALQCAMFGDARYAPDRLPTAVARVARDQGLVPQLHLHARELCFEHPVTRRMLHFTAELPPHMQHTITCLNLASDLRTHPRAQLTDDDFNRSK